MTYTPNFNDPRIQRTARRALTFVELNISSNQVHWISRQQMYQHFGNTTRPLGRWLRDQLLEVRDHYFNPLTGVCKKYSKRIKGVNAVKNLLNDPDFVPEIDPAILEQIRTGDFQYEEKSHRLFTAAQFIPKRIRDSKLNNEGYRYQYDIQAAAPSMLLQRAQTLSPGLELPALEYYIANRSEIRRLIAENTGISQDQAKTVINAVLQGSVITKYSGSKLFLELNQNYDSVIRLQNDEITQNLVRDIRELWKILKCEFSVGYITDKNGKLRKKRISSNQKSGYYRELEEQVGKIIRRKLKRINTRYLWIHDGWRCDKAIDPSEIELEVRKKTKLRIKIDMTIYEDN